MVFDGYAQYYDVIYRRKNYKKECVYLEKLFKKHAPRRVKTVLDLGCGTANHMVPFLEKGYKMTGVDASGQMLKLASQKLDKLNLRAELLKGKLQSFQLDHKFDTVICLFSVIDYITQKKALSLMLENVARHMKKTSLFIFDFWNESAVSGYYSPRKTNLFEFDGKTLERSSVTQVNSLKRLCEVNYTCSVRQNGKLLERNQEKHVLRYFSIDEMREHLKSVGLRAIDTHPFLNAQGKIKKNTWDVTMVAQKV